MADKDKILESLNELESEELLGATLQRLRQRGVKVKVSLVDEESEYRTEGVCESFIGNGDTFGRPTTEITLLGPEVPLRWSFKDKTLELKIQVDRLHDKYHRLGFSAKEIAAEFGCGAYVAMELADQLQRNPGGDAISGHRNEYETDWDGKVLTVRKVPK